MHEQAWLALNRGDKPLQYGATAMVVHEQAWLALDGTRQRRQATASAVHEQALLALDRDDKPRPTPESSRGSTTETPEQRVERPSVSSELGPDCGSWQGAPFIYGPA